MERPGLRETASGLWLLLLSHIDRLKAGFRDVKGSNLRAADYHLGASNFKDAYWRYQMVLKLEPDNTDALAGAAMCLISELKLDEARELLARARARQPDHPVVLAAAGVLARYSSPEQIVTVGGSPGGA
jgi:thioredoxin-like negative regulator of GroEL